MQWLVPLGMLASAARADQVVMLNGDTFNGAVLSVTTNTVVLKNENLGAVTLPRGKVSAILFGNVAAGAALPAAGPALRPMFPATNSAAASSTLRGLRDQTNLIAQVQSQFLAPAGPEAQKKFNELLNGLSTGSMDMNDLRAQAQSAADQLRAFKKDLGPDAGEEMDTYLSILDNFLQETTPAKAPGSTNAAAK